MILLYKLWESLRRIGTDCLLNVWWKWKLVSRVQFFGNPWTVVHGILQARILEWVAFPFSRGSSQPRDPTHVSCIAGEFFTSWATSSVQFSCSVVSDSLRPHGPQHTRLPCPSSSPEACSNSCSLNQWCHPTLSSCRPLVLLPSIFPSIRVFSNESALRIRWPKYWSFSFSISPSNEHPGLISFRMDWLDLLAVQGTLKSLLQHHSSKALILQCSALFMVLCSALATAVVNLIILSNLPSVPLMNNTPSPT